MKIFLLTHTHSNETRFASPVSLYLEKKLRGNHEVTRLTCQNEEKMEGYRDKPAEAAYKQLLEKGYEKGNEKHLVLDIHENPLNWPEFYGEYTRLYGDIAPLIEKSRKDGHFGIYVAELKEPAQYRDIRKMKRYEAGKLQERQSNFLRIEVPIMGREEKGMVLADVKKTIEHFGTSSKKNISQITGDIILSFLKI
ncbi:hypothetical protein HZC09_05310 [Candidatus Micrarchaeota archaeon]|nr:hypothetical protein [Candidatus Micrarchaeota archaeon]